MKNSQVYREIGTVVQKETLHSDTALLRIYSPLIAKGCLPGQFVHIRVADDLSPLLRRPYSIQKVIDNETIELLVKSYGRGSSYLLQKNIGDHLNILGPLGNGWSIPKEYHTILAVSGGVGVAPILFLQDRLVGDKKFIHILGAKSVNDLPVSHQTIQTYQIEIATEDGSYGFQGTSIQLFNHVVKKLDLSSIYLITCGPWEMMKKIYKFAIDHQVKGSLSAEARMGCAMGVCQGCAVVTKSSMNQHLFYALCCKDGPIFPFEMIDMEVNPFGN